MVSVSALYLSQTLVVVKLFIANKSHNISNIIWNALSWKTSMAVGIGEIYYQGWVWTVDTRVTYILFVLYSMANFKNN